MDDWYKKLPENVPGRFYVTDNCLACETCQAAAPNNFRYNDHGLSSVFSSQPLRKRSSNAKRRGRIVHWRQSGTTANLKAGPQIFATNPKEISAPQPGVASKA